MTDMRFLMKETCERFLNDVSSRENWEAQPHSTLLNTDWQDLVQLGLPRVALPEHLGGTDGDFGDMCELAYVSGHVGSYLPLVETMLGYWLCGFANVELPDDAVPILALRTLHTQADGEFFNNPVAGMEIENVPAARFATHFIVPLQSGPHGLALSVVPAENITRIKTGSNAADEPRDQICWLASAPASTPVPMPFGPERLISVCALLHALQMAGAMNRALEMTISYSLERSQFGRQLAKFQAVQHMIAQAAANVAAATTISRVAAEAWDKPSFDVLAASAKGRVSEAVKIVADVVHQGHGAMGFTRECLLHIFTRRLWCWREEYGNERFWYAHIGRQFRSRESGDLWSSIADLQ